jgi:hypothetical protein
MAPNTDSLLDGKIISEVHYLVLELICGYNLMGRMEVRGRAETHRLA